MRFVYTLMWYLLIPLVLLYFFWRGRRAPAYRQRWRERFGCHSRRCRESVWIHAASVGEVLAVPPLIEALLSRHPSPPLVITTTTPTGSERVQALFGDRVIHVYWPWDVPGSLRRFWRAFQPRLVILLEKELWPNLVAEADRRSVPVILANARLSEGSHRGYARWLSLVGPMLARIDAFAVQTAEEAERFIDLGAQRERVTVTGNVKFDITLDDSLRSRAARLREDLGHRPVWIAASTHAGEDEVMLAAHRVLCQQQPEALLILVPRHQERFDEVAAQVLASGHGLARRSLEQLPTPQTSVYLADTMGELLMLYGVADVAFVAGSLAPIGGHNLVEPALWSKPVITGPTLHNFTLIAELLDAAGAHRVVQDGAQLGALLGDLLSDPQQCQQMGERARQVVEQHRGALASLLKVLNRYWPAAL